MMNMNYRKRPASNLSGCGCLTLIASGILFFTSLIIFQGWMSNSPPWQARLYGIQTQGVVKSINADACNATSPDPGLINGGFVLRSLALVKIENNVLPTIQFTDRQGHRYELQENYCGDYGVGEQVAVWYLPTTPTTFALAHETDSNMMDVYGPLIGMLLSLLFVLGSVALLVFGAVQGRRAASRGSVSSAGSPWEAGVSPGAAGTFPWENQ
jgi:hypothetical protein